MCEEELKKVAEELAYSMLVPSKYQNKPEDCYVGIKAGMTLGLNAFQSLQNINVINGKPTVWGDVLIRLVRSHPDCKEIKESIDGDGDDRTATCTVKRNQVDKIEEITKTFSWKDAKKANLTTHESWKSYPDRMLQMRARGFAFRDSFSDIMEGVILREEVELG